MKVLMETHELQKRINDDELIVLDVRIKGEGEEKGKQAYLKGHIPGAIFLDVKKDVTGQNSFLPEADEFARKLASLGISERHKIVIYDEGNHRAAAKVWVMLHYMGHEEMYVLNGGIKAWQEDRYELSTEVKQKQPTMYHTQLREAVLMSLEQVKDSLHEKDFTLIDSRSYNRYSGEVEPKYKKAGHIPGAVNYETKQTSTEAGKIKYPSELEKHFRDLDKNDKIVVSCGSGNSAAVNMLALKEAGYHNVALFSGGFEEWIKDDNNEVATTIKNK